MENVNKEWYEKNKKQYLPKRKAKRITLKTKLAQIYNTIDLTTTCNRSLTCCKIACPALNYSEFCQLLNEIWEPANSTKEEKLNYLCTSIEYFFRNEFEKWGREGVFIKPCMLLSKDGTCSRYSSRPLSCRLYGLWPEDIYKARVDKFEKAYEGLLKREEIPLNTQCPHVKRVDESKPLTGEIINSLYGQLDELDKKVGNFTDNQVKNKENYRAFHDWLLYTFLGEDNLIALTRFMLGADKKTLEEQIAIFKKVWTEKLANDKLSVNLPKEVKED